MHRIIGQHHPRAGTIIRAMAAKLLAGGRISPHFDSDPSYRHGHRIHVPITTSRIAAGSPPSTVTLYDFDARETRGMVNLTMDIRNAIHGLEVWPF